MSAERLATAVSVQRAVRRLGQLAVHEESSQCVELPWPERPTHVKGVRPQARRNADRDERRLTMAADSSAFYVHKRDAPKAAEAGRGSWRRRCPDLISRFNKVSHVCHVQHIMTS